MKNIFMAFAAATCLLCSCSEDNTNSSADQGSISITGGGAIDAGPAGIEQAITVTSSGDWQLAGVCDWVHPSATSGKSGETVTFNVDPNSEGVSLETTFKFFTGMAIAPLKISSTSSHVLVLKSQPEVHYDKNAQELSILLRTNIDELTASFSEKGEEWIHYTARSEVFGSTTLAFSVDANTTYANRTSIITLTGADAKPLSIKVTQTQTDVVLFEEPSYSVALAGGPLTINLQSNIDYVVEVPAKYATWLHHQPAAPSVAPSTGLVTRTETFTIDAASGLRGGKINFKSADGLYSMTVAIVQSGDTHVYATVPDAIFRKYLEDMGYVVVLEDSKCEMTQAGQEVTAFVCDNLRIVSLAGIEAFTNATSLSLVNNRVAEIALGTSPIETVKISYSYARNIEISGPNITLINAANSSSYPESLDVSACSGLKTLDISGSMYFKTLYMLNGQIIPKILDSRAGYMTSAGKYKKVYK